MALLNDLGGTKMNNTVALCVLFEAITQLAERGGVTKTEWQALLAGYNWTVMMTSSPFTKDFRDDRNFVRKVFMMHMQATADKHRDEWIFNKNSDWQEVIDYFEARLK